MKLHYTAAVLLPFILLSANTARADDNFVYGTIGQGIGAGFGRVINDNFSVRADVDRVGSPVYQHNFGNNNYDIKSEASTRLNVLVDWFPITGSGFRVSGGLGFSNDQSYNSIATPNSSGNYIINGNTYSANTVGQLKATSTFNKVIPQIGIGWDSAPANKPGWRLMTGLNLSLISSGKTTLAATNSAQNSALLADVGAEQSRVNSDFGRHAAQLNVSVGVGYSF
ncbi:hypothetical protein [Solimicrobium silvestre]|uniref:Outer membrane protein beta-barrel domain n=1 Tax=Solimicrobium silvestre TaxID=2099400 RepID=A0A2S9H1G6_9BURK|nr:hypothetical protein [Solimicrobium silvestre]PRC93822.1 hypothetical protein S2091_1431 [Solimicrobium silvestre]